MTTSTPPAINKASPFALFETNTDLEKAGIDLDYGAFYLTVARAGGSNTRFGEVLRAKLAPYRRAIETETMDDELAGRLAVEAFAESVITGWGRFKVDEAGATVLDAQGNKVRVPGKMPWRDGSERDFSVENVTELFKLLPDLARDAMTQAQRQTLFRRTLAEIDGKN
jgi:hypothetical protein